MRVVRGQADTIGRDRSITDRLLAWASEGDVSVRVWSPHRQVAFGRRDVRKAGFDRASQIAQDRGFPVVERDVGGSAVAYTGTTLAFVRAQPANLRGSVDARYAQVMRAVRSALWEGGVDARPGEPPNSFCPGSHSLQRSGKVVGLAQRVKRDAAMTAGICVVTDHGTIAGVLQPVYRALDIPFDPDSVGSIARAGGDADPRRVARRIESALVGDREEEILSADSLAASE